VFYGSGQGMNMMKDSTMTMNMMHSMMKDGKMMNHMMHMMQMMQMMQNEGMMSEDCMQSSMKMIGDKGMNMGDMNN
jgi:hypothetical protein